ncbi:MAG: ABC transporter permease, partial [Candidatus Rokuibacteriota bacterium]
MTLEGLLALLAVAVTSGTPLIFAGLGELVTERSGILNLGVEGMMLAGAVMGFAVAVGTHSAWMGVAIAMLAGAALALGHAVL